MFPFQHTQDFFFASLNDPRDFLKKFLTRSAPVHFTYRPLTGGTASFLQQFGGVSPPEFQAKMTFRARIECHGDVAAMNSFWTSQMIWKIPKKYFGVGARRCDGHKGPQLSVTTRVFQQPCFLRLLPQKWATKNPTLKFHRKTTKNGSATFSVHTIFSLRVWMTLETFWKNSWLGPRRRISHIDP